MASGTHSLETASEGTSQETERMRPSECHSLPVDQIGRDNQNTKIVRLSKRHSPSMDRVARDKSGQGNNATE